jgi:hypothetical protein
MSAFGGKADMLRTALMSTYDSKRTSAGLEFLQRNARSRQSAKVPTVAAAMTRGYGSFAQVSSKSGKKTSSMVKRRFVNPCS